MSNVVADVEPDEFKLVQRETTSSFINKRRQIWVTPQAQDTFSPNKNPVIEFILSSNSDIVHFPESEIHATLVVNPQLQNEMYNLGIGGIHGFFSRMVLSSVGSGRVVEQCNDYNFIANMQTRLFMSKKMLRSLGRELRTASFPGAGDELEIFSFTPHLVSALTAVVDVSGGASVDISSVAAFVGTSGAILYYPTADVINLATTFKGDLTFYVPDDQHVFGIDQLLPGDHIDLRMTEHGAGVAASVAFQTISGIFEYVERQGNSLKIHFRSYDVSNDQNSVGVLTSTGTVALVEIRVIRSHNKTMMNRLHKNEINYNTVFSQDLTAPENEIRVVFKPQLETWKLDLPLFLLKGLRIQLFLDRFERSVQTDKALNLTSLATLASTSTYELKDVRMHCVYITPSEAMKNRFTAQYMLIDNENLGLTYPMTFWKMISHTTSTAATSHTFVINPGQRSVRAIFVTLSDNSIVGEFGHTALANNSFQSWISSGLQRWYGTVGSERFPAQEVRNDWVSEARTAGTNNSVKFGYPTKYYSQPQEAYKYLQDALGKTEIDLLPFEDFLPTSKNYPLPVVGAVNYQRDSTGFVMAFDFSKSKGAGGALTGIDFTNTQFTLNLQKLSHSEGNFPGSLTVQFYIMYDALVSISTRGIAVAD